MIFDKAYFIRKFTLIPDEFWTIGEFSETNHPEKHCAFGWCGCTADNDETEEANALDRLFRNNNLLVTAVNDADGSGHAGIFTQPTPKARILAALESFA